MIKLIASDIDGTLIKDSTPNLYPEMVEAIEALSQKGIMFCACSGRQFPSMQNVFRDVKADIMYICENGAHIRYKDQDIHLIEMKRELVEELMPQLREYYGTCDSIVSTPGCSLVESKNREYIDLLRYGYHNTFDLVEDVLEDTRPILKVSIYQKESIRSLGEEILIPRWKDRLKATMAGEEWVDFMDLATDKGNALKYVQDYLGISHEETMAFGDNNNDIGMLQAAGTSYAVENARDEVKAVATHICPSYLDKGVYQIVKELL